MCLWTGFYFDFKIVYRSKFISVRNLFPRKKEWLIRNLFSYKHSRMKKKMLPVDPYIIDEVWGWHMVLETYSVLFIVILLNFQKNRKFRNCFVDTYFHRLWCKAFFLPVYHSVHSHGIFVMSSLIRYLRLGNIEYFLRLIFLSSNNVSIWPLQIQAFQTYFCLLEKTRKRHEVNSYFGSVPSRFF